MPQKLIAFQSQRTEDIFYVEIKYHIQIFHFHEKIGTVSYIAKYLFPFISFNCLYPKISIFQTQTSMKTRLIKTDCTKVREG